MYDGHSENVDPTSDSPVRERREALRLSQRALAERARVQRTHLSDIERGLVPGSAVRARLARALEADERMLWPGRATRATELDRRFTRLLGRILREAVIFDLLPGLEAKIEGENVSLRIGPRRVWESREGKLDGELLVAEYSAGDQVVRVGEIRGGKIAWAGEAVAAADLEPDDG